MKDLEKELEKKIDKELEEELKRELEKDLVLKVELEPVNEQARGWVIGWVNGLLSGRVNGRLSGSVKDCEAPELEKEKRKKKRFQAREKDHGNRELVNEQQDFEWEKLHVHVEDPLNELLDKELVKVPVNELKKVRKQSMIESPPLPSTPAADGAILATHPLLRVPISPFRWAFLPAFPAPRRLLRWPMRLCGAQAEETETGLEWSRSKGWNVGNPCRLYAEDFRPDWDSFLIVHPAIRFRNLLLLHFHFHFRFRFRFLHCDCLLMGLSRI